MNPTAAEKLGIQPFDAADYLQSDEDCAMYLQACIEQAPDDAALFAKALGDIVRARGMMHACPRHRHHPRRALQGLERAREPDLVHSLEGAACAGHAAAH